MNRIATGTVGMQLYFVINARMPNKKAYGIQVAKMCEAFIESGVNLKLIVPRTRAARSTSIQEFYKLRVEVPTQMLPAIDWYGFGKLAFIVSSLVFMLTSGLYVWWRRLSGERFIVYTVEMDTLSFTCLSLSGAAVVVEMHGPQSSNIFTRFFFRHVSFVVATNSEIKNSLKDMFHIADEKFLVEPNGADLTALGHVPNREEARKRLAVSPDVKIALYVGRFFEWKGLEILTDAARRAPEIAWYVVGGSLEEFCAVTGVQNIPENLHVVGECESYEVPIWLSAADALVILGTKNNEASFRHTSPMKVFEYMAAQRPIIASDTPALRSIVSEEYVHFYVPDDATSLSERVKEVLGSPEGGTHTSNARTFAEQHSWSRRAQRIIERVILAQEARENIKNKQLI